MTIRHVAREDGDLRLDVTVNGRVRSPVRVTLRSAGTTEDILTVDTIDICSQEHRTALVASLPEDRRDAGARLALAVGSEVASLREIDAEQEAGETEGVPALFRPVTPWTETVDGAALLDDLVATFERYCVLPDGGVHAIALWVLFAWAHDAFSVSPILGITSPTKRCGKTQVLEVAAVLVPFPLTTSNVSAAVLFRVVDQLVRKHARAPTILFDEADTTLPDREELRGVINSGHRRASAFVWRCAGEDKDEPTGFSTWAPKAIAMIGALPDTIADRSVPIVMRRRLPDEKVSQIRLDRLREECDHLRRRAARWAVDALVELRERDPAVPPGLHDRAADNWRPLLAIADTAAGPWPDRARKAATLICGTGSEEETPETLLLADIWELFAPNKAAHLRTSYILERLVGRDDRPWGQWSKGKPLNPYGLGRLLKRFDIQPTTFRDGNDSPKGYARKDVKAQARRYKGFQSATSATSLQHNDLGPFQSATPVADPNAPKSLQDNDVADVADSNPPAAENCGETGNPLADAALDKALADEHRRARCAGAAP